MYGVEIPRDWESARCLDRTIGNTKWADANQLEIKQLFDYEFSKDNGMLEAHDPKLDGYTKIPCQMIYAVKHDGRHKARFVAGGHLT